ncbi:MAG: hypothetical protein GXO77_03610 [Calditrichaeota bacterium]|nr:hypothetical protein [Calditrichota bacterium]
MRIESLQISGFKGYEQTTTINFFDEHGNLIFDTEGEERIFIFKAILGIIFGFSPDEKKHFRGDVALNQTFTGLVTLVLDQKTVLIERDFETDIIACLLSDNSSSRPIFQGKDIVENGYSRPYLEMLRSIFPIVDKSLYLEILQEEIYEGSSLSNLLHSLYLLLSPRFNLNKVRHLISKSEAYITTIDTSRLDSKNLEQLNQFRECLVFLKSVAHFRQQLKSDLDKFNQLLRKIRQRDIHKDAILNQIEESFKELHGHNPILLRAEILLWKSLAQMKEQNEAELKKVRQRKDEIEHILQIDLAEYNQLPDFIDKEIKKYQDNNKKIQKTQKKIEVLDTEIKLNEVKYNTWKTVKLFFLGFVTPISFILSYIAFNSWFLIIPEAFFFFLIFLFLFGHYHSKIRERLLNFQEERDIFQKRINDTLKEQKVLQQKWYFLKDKKSFHIHEERLNKFKALKTELRHLKQQEDRIRQNLSQPSLTRQLQTFKQKYGGLVDINRPDLEDYLDKFVRLKSELSSIETSEVEPPVIQEIQKIIKDYRDAIHQLKHIEEELSERLHLHQYNLAVDKILEAITRRIKNLQMQQGITFEY